MTKLRKNIGSHKKDEILTVETDLILKGEKRTVWAKAAPLYDQGRKLGWEYRSHT